MRKFKYIFTVINLIGIVIDIVIVCIWMFIWIKCQCNSIYALDDVSKKNGQCVSKNRTVYNKCHIVMHKVQNKLS